jgi:23S rRNA (cytidine1920-2'-O)/16S rRNA (cytidine1409-2'-O)-methyltransferase
VAKKKRLDVVLTERGLAPSRARAQALILAGKVRLRGEVESKAGTQVEPDAPIEISEPDHPWVSRGALKLVAALDEFEISPDGLDCLDIGASTGGFTDVLLERGARQVVAVDVGRGQLDWRLRNDPRVVVISLRLVVPALLPHLIAGARLVCLVKPQFEAGRDQVGKGGIVRDEAIRRQAIDNTVAALVDLGLESVGVIPSPIRGQKGNLEELAVFRWPSELVKG